MTTVAKREDNKGEKGFLDIRFTGVEADKHYLTLLHESSSSATVLPK
jgi:hypothetical protein